MDVKYVALLLLAIWITLFVMDSSITSFPVEVNISTFLWCKIIMTPKHLPLRLKTTFFVISRLRENQLETVDHET